MEGLENKMEPAESLQLIMEVIGKTRENIKEHGYLFLLWGWLIACASILFYLLHTANTSNCRLILARPSARRGRNPPLRFL